MINLSIAKNGHAKDGIIVSAGYRLSETAKHHSGIERLWGLAGVNAKGGCYNE